MKKRFLGITLLAVCSLLTVHADEGMWLLQLLEQQHSIEIMKKKGLKLEAKDIYNPNGVSLKDAVGIFGGGCTGEIISPEGLILTNHHCGYSSIQQHSSVEHDYLTNGFWAKNKSEELPTPGLKFRFVHRIVNITDIVEKEIKEGRVSEVQAMTRPFLSRIAEQELAKSDLKGKPGIVAQALPYYAGNSYYLVYYKVYSDVRMVAAPPESIGKFGGETDNWMWPRHTCDFSIFRIYADKNGEPADYNAGNVPLKTPKYLNISLKGIEENDYAMVMGFPGSTERYLTGEEVKFLMETENTPRIDMRTVKLNVLREKMAQSDQTRIQYANKFAGSSNYWKNAIGMNKAIVDNKVIEHKLENEAKFNEFAKGKSDYEGVIDKINQQVKGSYQNAKQGTYLAEGILNGVEFFSPIRLYEMLEKGWETKNDSLTNATLKDLETYYDELHDKDYDHEVDRALAKAMIPALAEHLSADELPTFYQTIQTKYKGDTNAYVDDMYDHSIMANRTNLEKFLKKPTEKSLKNDLNYEFTKSSFEKYFEIYALNRASASELDLLHKAYIRGLGEMNAPAPMYPDANFTMRLTYGTVKPYDPKDGVTYKYYTTGEGVLQKENPNDPEFKVPAKLKELLLAGDFGRYAMKNGALPACFLTTNDITGGNSGSPVLNAEGQLIGAAFDGNWESLSNDITYDDELNRCICVDIRYILFIVDKLGGCQNLLNEMTIIE